MRGHFFASFAIATFGRNARHRFKNGHSRIYWLPLRKLRIIRKLRKIRIIRKLRIIRILVFHHVVRGGKVKPTCASLCRHSWVFEKPIFSSADLFFWLLVIGNVPQVYLVAPRHTPSRCNRTSESFPQTHSQLPTDAKNTKKSRSLFFAILLVCSVKSGPVSLIVSTAVTFLSQGLGNGPFA